MTHKDWSRPVTDWIGAIMFSGLHHTIRRKHARALLLSIFIGLVFCAGFGSVLVILSRQGRI